MHDASPLVPEITEQDIEWVRSLMRLDALDEPRLTFLTSRSTLDVSACPGSGKTTLIVAKLAILARKWTHQSNGICVLSHTNVAREEIQRRLGSTVVGHRLLGYPHFIDTIHGFVNRFLALPWLNSNGYPPPTIDNDVTTGYRRGTLARGDYWKVQSFLTQKYSAFDRLRICARDLSFDLGGKPFPANSAAPTFGFAKQAIEAAANAGYFCYDEMFVWARALLEDYPDVASWLRRRFPVVILDEMQDTFELQGALLHAVFPRASPDIIVQRVGDPNQAIFDDAEAEPNRSDPFPDPDAARNLTIPNSYRFGPEVATLASPFAAIPVGTTGLCGIGPKATVGATTPCRHAIFVFPGASTTGVLDNFGKHVLTTFGDSALKNGVVTAVGAVHQEAADVSPGHAHFPKSVPHYWSGYAAEITRKRPHPSSLVQYVRAARAVAGDGYDLASAVETVASGLIRLAGRIGDTKKLNQRARTHRAIVDALAANVPALALYRRLVRVLLIDKQPLTEKSWKAMQRDILAISGALCDGSGVNDAAGDFLMWSGDSLASNIEVSPSTNIGANVYRVTDVGRYVDVRLGSIHSVKGQTHLATLILSTYWHDHSSQRMLPWLLGTRVNEASSGARDRKRLLQMYVAMTRPSHLICLAVPRFIFDNDQSMIQQKAVLEERGWQVAEIVDGVARWHQGG